LWNRNRDTGKSTYEIFRDNGIILTKASNNRVSGWLAVKEWLKIRKKRNEQTGTLEEVSDLVIFNTCLTLIEYLPQIQHDEKNPNDCANEPHELTHICDALRYFCVSRVSPSKEIVDKENTFSNFFEEDTKIYDYGEEIVVI
jgi:phage terminase large subunit